MWKFILIVALVLPAVFGTTEDENKKGKGNIWAVLVAGSNEFYNYRHQADVCHAYQIFRRHGIPDSRIIVMMYDDIAHNTENPNQGVIINKPGGPNVYKHVPKDYTGANVTPDNFLHVLTGNRKALEGKGSGKVLKSGPNDHVFIYYTDHGAEGIVGFPDGTVLHADDLIKALKTMHKKKMYKKLVFYMEACEAGSMFQNILPKNMNIFATTAANPTQSSYACYFDKSLNTYLGDEYSVAWMENTDTADRKGKLTRETLSAQFRSVVKRVVHSNPQMYGKMTMKKEHLKDYVGMGKKKMDTIDETEQDVESFQDSVPSRDVPIHILQNKIQLTDNLQEKKSLEMKLAEMIKGRKIVNDLFKSILSHVNPLNGDLTSLENEHQPLTEEARPCYKTVVESFRQNCVSLKNTYAMAHLYKLANLCVKDYSTYDILQALTAKCDERHRTLTGVY